jgi:hypothetical protein
MALLLPLTMTTMAVQTKSSRRLPAIRLTADALYAGGTRMGFTRHGTVMIKLLLTALASAILVAFCTSSQAALEECKSALRYDSALAQIEHTLHRYTRCISNSKGQDDCYSAFRRVQSAQDDFETAVSSFNSECN